METKPQPITVHINDVKLENVHIALGIAIVFGVGLFCGWLLTCWGVFAVIPLPI